MSKWHLKLSSLWTTVTGKSDGLGTPKSVNLPDAVESYDEYQRKATFQKISCVDIDCIHDIGESYVGIEATHLFKPMHSREKALHLCSIILEKRFLGNRHQLHVQKNLMNLVGGKLYLLVYNITGKKLGLQGF